MKCLRCGFSSEEHKFISLTLLKQVYGDKVFDLIECNKNGGFIDNIEIYRLFRNTNDTPISEEIISSYKPEVVFITKRRSGYKKFVYPPKPEHIPPTAKITPCVFDMIKDLCKCGAYSQNEIAKLFKISSTTVYLIKNGWFERPYELI